MRLASWLLILATLPPAVLAQGTTPPHSSEIVFPTQTSLHGPLLALSLNDTDTIESLVLRADEARISYYQVNRTTVGVGGIYVRQADVRTEAQYVLHTATFVLDPSGDHSGHMGVRTLDDAPTYEAEGRTRIRPALRSVVGNGAVPDGPANWWFHESAEGPHLYSYGAYAFAYYGGASIKIHGLDLLVTASENSTRLNTGSSSPSAPVGESRDAWVVIESANLSLTVEGAPEVRALLREAQVEWTGFAPEGTTEPGHRYGSWRVDLRPIMRGGAPVADMHLEAVTAPRAPPVGSWPAPRYLVFGFAGGLGLGFAGVALCASVIGRRRRARLRRLHRGPGEWELQQALLLRGMGDDEGAAAFLVQALHAQPRLLDEVRRARGLRPLLHRDDVATAMEHADEKQRGPSG